LFRFSDNNLLNPFYIVVQILNGRPSSSSTSVLVLGWFPYNNDNKKTRFNDRSLCTIGPTLWNNLPWYIKQSVSIHVFLRKHSKRTILDSFITL